MNHDIMDLKEDTPLLCVDSGHDRLSTCLGAAYRHSATE